MDDPLANGPHPRDLRDTQLGNGARRSAAGRGDQTALDVEEIKRGASILDVLDRFRIAVEGSGLSRRACCPFHEDRIPSFRVYLNTNRYYCFGCGAKGDVIELVQRLEGVSFREALQRLATIAPSPPAASADRVALETASSSPWPADRGVAVHRNQTLLGQSAALGAVPAADRDGLGASADVDDDTLVAGLLAAAAALYQESLLHTPRALAYLLARGITRSISIEARLGFSDGTTLRRYIGHDPALVRCATRVGLLDGWGHERLRERLVMPAFRGGRCIWMIGRLLREGAEESNDVQDALDGANVAGRRARSPRYLGLALPKPLIGFDLVPAFGEQGVQGGAQDGVRRGVLVVEGIFDLLTVRAWRLSMACVALVGTHLRRDQLQDLLALACGGPIWLGLDADEAGEQAAERLRDQLVKAGCPGDVVRRLRPPGGAKDLSEVARDAHARRAVLAALAADGGPDGHVLGHQVSAGSDAEPTGYSMLPPHVRELARPGGGDNDAALA
jgi:hypothetical protein